MGMAMADMASYFDEVRHSLLRAQDAAEKALTEEADALREKSRAENRRLQNDIHEHKEELARMKLDLDLLATENMKLRRLQLERGAPTSPGFEAGEDAVDAHNAVALSPESSPERDVRVRDRPKQHQTTRPRAQNAENEPDSAGEDAPGGAAPSPSPPVSDRQGGARAVTEGPVSSRFLRSRSLTPARSPSPGQRPDGHPAGPARARSPEPPEAGAQLQPERRPERSRLSPSSRGGSLHSPRSRSGSVARGPQARQPSADWQGAGRSEPGGRERSRSRGLCDRRSRSRGDRPPDGRRSPRADGWRPGFDDRDPRPERTPPWDDSWDPRRERRSPIRPDARTSEGWRSPVRPNGWDHRGDSRDRPRSSSRAIRRPAPGQQRDLRDRDPPPRRGDQLCIPWATGKCRKGDACKDGHPPQDEAKRILDIIQRKPCRFGKECRRPDCIFTHREEREPLRHTAR